MAKYTIEHRCGHTSVKELYGKHSDRDQKISWLEDQDCPQCWAKKKRAEENAAGSKFRIVICVGGAVEVQGVAGTYPIKDTLKSRGYRYTECGQGALGSIFNTALPPKNWVLSCGTLDAAITEGRWLAAQGYNVDYDSSEMLVTNAVNDSLQAGRTTN